MFSVLLSTDLNWFQMPEVCYFCVQVSCKNTVPRLFYIKPFSVYIFIFKEYKIQKSVVLPTDKSELAGVPNGPKSVFHKFLS